MSQTTTTVDRLNAALAAHRAGKKRRAARLARSAARQKPLTSDRLTHALAAWTSPERAWLADVAKGLNELHRSRGAWAVGYATITSAFAVPALSDPGAALIPDLVVGGCVVLGCALLGGSVAVASSTEPRSRAWARALRPDDRLSLVGGRYCR